MCSVNNRNGKESCLNFNKLNYSLIAEIGYLLVFGPPSCIHLEEPPNLDPTEYGWCKDEETKSLQPVNFHPQSSQHQTTFLKLVCCTCASERPCHTRRCGCVAAHLACTAFCHCPESSICKNEQTRAVIEESDEDEYQEPIS